MVKGKYLNSYESLEKEKFRWNYDIKYIITIKTILTIRW